MAYGRGQDTGVRLVWSRGRKRGCLMRTKITIGLLCIAAVLAGTGVASAQAAPATANMRPPSGDAET